MTSGRARVAIILTAVFGGLAAEPARAGLALEFTSGNAVHYTGASAAAGWSFRTQKAINVTALDAFDPGAGVRVRLYDASGTTLASATVTSADPALGSPIAFHAHTIAPVTLAADTTYFVSQDTDPALLIFIQANGLTTDPSITYQGGVIGNAGQNPLKDSPNGINFYQPDYFGPNFNIGPAVSVPEPSTAVLAAAGILGFLLRGRRRASA